MEIKLVTAADILPLRHKILRPGEKIEKAMYPDDDDSDTFHVAVYLENQLGSVATFVKESKSEFNGFGYRLRGMATESTRQNLGLGKAVLIYGLNECKKRNVDYVWCNARLIAFSFYEKLGFQFHGELFDIPGINLHKVMYKYL